VTQMATVAVDASSLASNIDDPNESNSETGGLIARCKGGSHEYFLPDVIVHVFSHIRLASFCNGIQPFGSVRHGLDSPRVFSPNEDRSH
jgi:hypothetical protein